MEEAKRKGKTQFSRYLLMNREWTLDLDGNRQAYYSWAQECKCVLITGIIGMTDVITGISKGNRLPHDKGDRKRLSCRLMIICIKYFQLVWAQRKSTSQKTLYSYYNDRSCHYKEGVIWPRPTLTSVNQYLNCSSRWLAESTLLDFCQVS